MTRAFGSIAIGGTKCSVALGIPSPESVEWRADITFPTPPTSSQALDALKDALGSMLLDNADVELGGIGLVCGGPLDESAGLILSPPNLSAWDRVDVITPFTDRFDVPVRLMNDANAGVLAEWAWGSAKGSSSAIFITMGTGFGAGLILNGRLHEGASGLAGEIGHWRLADYGPEGYGKDGSFEGFCSGAGIARWTQETAREQLSLEPNADPAWRELEHATAQQLGALADAGNPRALEMWLAVGERLGVGLSLLIDLLSPDVIVIGGIFVRQHHRLEPSMNEKLRRETLPLSLADCSIRPSSLGEEISQYSAMAVAMIGELTTSAGALLSSAVSSR
jgi:glucokinase